MKNEKDLQFETKVVHSSYNSNKHGECLTPPIYQTSTFTFPSMEQGAKRFSQEQGGYVYSRLENPTVAILEDRIAQLEEAEAGLAFSSGWQLFQPL
ncbi:methionine gamma-lyase [Halalkalibacter wakoensis JCM 9140]|uniref:Methionine gamma-lyase n=1 Tax=Halalkalibacter wakoensis JCM 9140 TaxID=1236970 RepID=W4PX03_9BACI|nr:methionine gamma-lyase [Halalkalibacter wakoensis JCM 9140]